MFVQLYPSIAQEIMIRFYRAIIESILTFSIVVWFSRASQEEKQQQEPIVKGASRIIGRELSFIESVYQARCTRKSRSIARDTTHPANHCTGYNPPSQPLHGIQPTQPTIARDTTHPANHLFELRPSGKHYRSIKTRTTRLKNIFTRRL